MSGGSYNYMFNDIEYCYVGKMHDIELNEMMKDLCKLLKELEWWQSSDTAQEQYREEVRKFKNKWFGKTQKQRAEALIAKSVEDFENNLRVALFQENEPEQY